MSKEFLLLGVEVGAIVLGLKCGAPKLVDEKAGCVSFDEAANIVYHPLFWDEDGGGGEGNFESIFAQKSAPGEKGYVHDDDVLRNWNMWNSKEARWYTDEETKAMGVDPIITFEGDADIDGYRRTTKHSRITLTDGTVIEPVESCYTPD